MPSDGRSGEGVVASTPDHVGEEQEDREDRDRQNYCAERNLGSERQGGRTNLIGLVGAFTSLGRDHRPNDASVEYHRTGRSGRSDYSVGRRERTVANGTYARYSGRDGPSNRALRSLVGQPSASNARRAAVVRQAMNIDWCVDPSTSRATMHVRSRGNRCL